MFVVCFGLPLFVLLLTLGALRGVLAFTLAIPRLMSEPHARHRQSLDVIPGKGGSGALYPVFEVMILCEGSFGVLRSNHQLLWHSKLRFQEESLCVTLDALCLYEASCCMCFLSQVSVVIVIYGKSCHLALEKLFDFIPRNASLLWYLGRHFSVPEHVIRLYAS